MSSSLQLPEGNPFANAVRWCNLPPASLNIDFGAVRSNVVAELKEMSSAFSGNGSKEIEPVRATLCGVEVDLHPVNILNGAVILAVECVDEERFGKVLGIDLCGEQSIDLFMKVLNRGGSMRALPGIMAYYVHDPEFDGFMNHGNPEAGYAFSFLKENL